ncbi:cytochrome c [Alicyclobacillus sp.]|uniref:c-type cytochrome n=1 Tax=Alicyclobacillus sp. TaxID=61169 RepID=UPI0025BD6548|nr:cytochrome c [Alicyclobacillus sp.]MCL6515567.1 cytochrome c [Alicyclobacillus sp.]
MRYRRCVAASLAVLGVSVGAVGCGFNRPSGITEADRTGPYREAVQLYLNGCNSCHGDNLEGGVGPSLAKVGDRLTEAELVRRIADGGGPMPAYGPDGQGILTPAQIQLLASWLATKK